MGSMTKLRGRPAVILHVDGGDDFGVDKVTPVPYTFGIVTSQSRDGSQARIVTDVDGVPHKATRHTHLLPPGILPCGLMTALEHGEVEGSGVASVSELQAVVRALIHTASHRDSAVRHDLPGGDPCMCDSRGWR